MCKSIARQMNGALRRGLLIVSCFLLVVLALSPSAAWAVRVGFGHTDITPDVHGPNPVWIAGYGPGRQATGVHDPLYARCVVLEDAGEKIAILSLDAIGLQLPDVERIRAQLADFRYVLVSSTHNHEAPDVIGIWGKTPLHRGADDAYLELLIRRAAEAVRLAESQLQETTASFGTAKDEALLNDSRLPVAKDGVLRALRFSSLDGQQPLGMLVQWNCHPEAMGSRNTEITADFPAATIQWLETHHKCPVVYITGTVGGLMAPVRGLIRNDAGELLHEGDFEYSDRYGKEVGKLADRALAEAQSLELTPFHVSSLRVSLPVRNPLYRLARALGVVRRGGRVWTGDPNELGDPIRLFNATKPTAVETEVTYLRLGELHIAAIPGEIYPELIYGQFQEPVEANVDFPDAPLEPTVQETLPGPHWMLFGLANDEVGYIIPRRQWDQEAPYAYGRRRSQYGEINSCGPDTAPIIMQALRDAVQGKPVVEAAAP